MVKLRLDEKNPELSRRTILMGGAVALVVGTAAIARPALLTAGTIGDADALARDHGFRGAVMLGKHGRPRIARAIGLADIAAGVAIAPDTSFGIASISKRLTAVAVMRLVERGKLSLDATISACLPEYRADTGVRVRLRHLLSNSSGIPNLFSPAVHLDATLVSQELPTMEAIRRFSSGDLTFEPGTKFDYTPTNWFIVLGILERAMGMPYAEAMRVLVTEPLGLKSTIAHPPAGAAKSYRSIAPVAEWIDWHPAYRAASGGFYSTTRDLLHFAHKVYDTGFLSAASRKALTTIEAPTDDYALGGRIRQVPIGGRIVTAAWETGNVAGYRSVLGHCLDGSGTVVLLNNTGLSQRTMDELAGKLLKLV